jgi:hypothetical protein
MSAKRVVRTVSGFFLMAAGAAMLVLPGPGILTIALGLGILSREYEWARRSLDKMKQTAHDVTSRVTGKAR